MRCGQWAAVLGRCLARGRAEGLGAGGDPGSSEAGHGELAPAIPERAALGAFPALLPAPAALPCRRSAPGISTAGQSGTGFPSFFSLVKGGSAALSHLEVCR